jgi:hypothetical protein
MRSVFGIVLLFCLHSGTVGSAQEAGSRDLLGTWDDVTPAPPRAGYRMPRDWGSVTFQGSACVWADSGGRTTRQSLFVPVRSGSQRGLDFVTVCDGRFCTTRALFTIEGDILTIKEGALDRPRPAALTAGGFDGHDVDSMLPVYVFKRRAR